jgi:hypothetical protein
MSHCEASDGAVKTNPLGYERFRGLLVWNHNQASIDTLLGYVLLLVFIVSGLFLSVVAIEMVSTPSSFSSC